MSTNFNNIYSASSVNPMYVTPQMRSSASIARELIFKSKIKGANISMFYKEMLRSIINTFSNFVIFDGEEKTIEVQCIHASQERAIAKLTQETNLILPIISVDQPKSVRNEKRQRYGPMVVSEKFSDPIKKRNYRLISLVPTPIEVEYQVSVWSKYKSDLDQITEQLHSAFNPDLEITTSFGTNIKLFLKEETLDSDLVVADREDRVIKRIFTLSASTYIPSPKFLMTSTGEIEEFHIEFDLGNNTKVESINNLKDEDSV